MRFLRTHCYLHHLLRTSCEASPLHSVVTFSSSKWHSSKSGSEQEKKAKSVQLTSRITPHDLQIKVKKAADLVHKGHTTRIAIKNMNPADTKTPANIFKEFTSAVKEFASVKQSQSSPTELVFTLKPNTSSDGSGDTGEESKSELKPAKLHDTTGAKMETGKS